MDALILLSLGLSILAVIGVIVILLLQPTRSDRAHLIREEVADQLARRPL